VDERRWPVCSVKFFLTEDNYWINVATISFMRPLDPGSDRGAIFFITEPKDPLYLSSKDWKELQLLLSSCRL
jgi:hypothetical protein